MVSEKKAHIPMRMCAVTREKLPKKDLVRIAVEDGVVVVDTKGKVKSRGINIKPDLEVFEGLIKKQLIKRSLGVNINTDEVEVLRQSFAKNVEEMFRGQKVVRITNADLNNILRKGK